MIRVLIVHDFPIICNLITAALQNTPDIQIVGCVATIQEALEFSRQTNVDVVLVSIRLPEQGALRITTALSQADPQVKVMVFGISEDYEQVLPFIEAGASGYIKKDESVADLVDRIHAARSGQALVSPQIAAALMQRLAEWAQLFPPGSLDVIDLKNLTPREREVLDLLGENLTNQEIAERLSIEVGTVKLHIHSILRKLGVESRQRAAAFLAVFRHTSNISK